MTKQDYDFCGYATKNDLVCADGRIIRKNAFKGNDGTTVPLVWNHRHDDPEMVIGHALLENKPDGVMAYCWLNDTERGRTCKKIIENQDLKGLSIYANKLHQKAGEVFHGVIQELSLVLQPANPGALIDFSFAHSDDDDNDCLYAYMLFDDTLQHSEEDSVDKEETKKEEQSEEKTSEKKIPSIREAIDSMTEEQKTAMYAVIAALGDIDTGDDDDDEDEDEGENKSMKHNIFEGDNTQNVLSHADEEMIVAAAKEDGSFRRTFNAFCEENELKHDAISSGFSQNANVDGNITWLFPEYKDLKPGAPELITNDQGWIGTVLNKVHKSPISRVRTSQVDIRNLDDLRARGYKKGKQKQLTGNFTLARRTTDPQTVYVKSQLHRDDIIDITDFDYVQYLYNIDKMQLNEELATAILLGDGRNEASEDKIMPEHIRPIWTDDELYTIHYDVDIDAARQTLQGTNTAGYFGDNYVYAEAMIEAALYSRERFKGTGTPDMFIHPHTLNIMLLARDMNGRRIFSGKNELASALNVGNIYTVEQFEGKTRTDDDNHEHKLLAIICNLADYTVGSTKGGQITHFTQFDIDFNMQKSLLETRCSGTLTRLWSAIALEEPVTSQNP